MSTNPYINLGWKMKRWLRRVIDDDFGEQVSFAKGLYNIITLYLQYVPRRAIEDMKKNGGFRV